MTAHNDLNKKVTLINQCYLLNINLNIQKISFIFTAVRSYFFVNDVIIIP